LFYFDAGSVISIIIVALSAGCIYLAYDITRITAGAPKAWYVIIAAFAVLLVKRAGQAYYDIISRTNDISLDEATTTLMVVLLFVVGLYMLNRTFRKQFKVSQEDLEQAYLEKNNSNHRFSRLLADGMISSSNPCSVVALKTISLKVHA
jgi:hypothetical protein